MEGGGYHSTALTSDGSVWAWGQDSYGQLGDGVASTTSLTPIRVPGLGDVASVSVSQISDGLYHTAALRRDGTVWTWGDNQHGQLGDGTTTLRSRPVQVPGLSGVTAVTVGYHWSLAPANWPYHGHWIDTPADWARLRADAGRR